MKKYILYSIFWSATFLLTGCEKFLDKQPIAKVTTSGYYNSKENAILAVNGIYDPIGWGDHENDFMQFIGDACSDDCETGGDPGAFDFGEFSQYSTYKPNPADMTKKFVQNYYVGIQRANTLLEQTQNVGYDASRFRGEASFLRAIYYFRLVQAFGPMPILLNTSSDNYYPSNREKDDDAKGSKYIAKIYKQIILDLQYAAKTLPHKGEYAQSDAGRATKGAAWGYLAKVYAFMASYNSTGFLFLDENKSDLWKKVNAYADSVVKSNDYQLESDYHNLFTVANKNGSESLFEIQHLVGSSNGGGNKDEGSILACDFAPRSWFDLSQKDAISTNNKTIGYGGDCPTPDLVSQFDLNNGTAIPTHWSGAYTPVIPMNIVQNGKRAENLWIMADMKANQPDLNNAKKYTDYDARIDMIVKPNDSVYDSYFGTKKWQKFCAFLHHGTDLSDFACTGFWNRKTQNGQSSGTAIQESALNTILLRYADILLLQAEALININGANDPNAIANVNLIRTRARNSFWRISIADSISSVRRGYKLVSSTTPADVSTLSIEDVYKERRLELFCEGQRFFDIVRWGKANDICPNRPTEYHGSDFKSWKGTNSYFLPIPPTIVSEGKGKIIQNPGY